ncbi:MAG: DUF5050 domain-containing protein, partial [Gammaproteobacteria bacterium]|nr:DUF5050 domain-containing protein [Gammaproteobacteria bacterium]
MRCRMQQRQVAARRYCWVTQQIQNLSRACYKNGFLIHRVLSSPFNKCCVWIKRTFAILFVSIVFSADLHAANYIYDTTLDENSLNGATVTIVPETGVVPGNFSKMFYANRLASPDGVIYQANTADGSGKSSLISSLDFPVGIAIDYAAGKMYFTTATAIHSANLDGSGIVDLVTGLAAPKDIELDLVNNKIYWLDLVDDDIYRANLDGSGQEAIILESANLGGIALDVGRGKIYWTETTTNVINRANLDGSSPVEIISGENGPTDIDFDSVNDKIYWGNYNGGSDTIVRADFDGTNRESIVTTGVDNPWYITLDLAAEKIYWTNDTTNDTVNSADMNALNSNITTLDTIPSIVTLRGIALIDPAPATVTYTITAGNTGNAFAINSSTGEITVNDNTQLDYVSTPSYALTVEVETAAPLNVDTATVNIDINEPDLVIPPGTIYLHPSSDVTANEFDNVGTCVGNPHYDCVNDQTGNAGVGAVEAYDGVTSYLSSNGTTEMFGLDNDALPTGTVATAITVYAQVGRANAGADPSA